MATADDTGFTFVGAGAGNITRSVYINAFPEWMREAARSSPDKNSLLALTNQCLRLEKTCLVEGSCEAAVQRAQTGGEEQALRDFLALNEYYINVIQQRNTIIFGAGPSGLTLASACPLGEAVVLEKRTEAKYNRRYYILFFRKETVEQMEAFDGLRGIRKAMIAVSRAPWDAPAGTIVPVVRAEDEASAVGFVTRLGDLQDALYIRALHRRGNPTFFESRVDMDKIKKQFPEKNVVDATGGRGRHAIEDGQFGGTVTLSSDLPPEDMQPFLLQPAGTFQGKVQTRYFCVQEPRSETYTYYFGLRLTRVQYQAFRRHPGYLPMLVFDPERYFSMLDDGTIRNVQQNVHIVFITQDGEPEAPGSVIRIGDAKRSVDFFLATGATKGVKDALALAETLSPG